MFIFQTECERLIDDEWKFWEYPEIHSGVITGPALIIGVREVNWGILDGSMCLEMDISHKGIMVILLDSWPPRWTVGSYRLRNIRIDEPMRCSLLAYRISHLPCSIANSMNYSTLDVLGETAYQNLTNFGLEIEVIFSSSNVLSYLYRFIST